MLMDLNESITYCIWAKWGSFQQVHVLPFVTGLKGMYFLHIQLFCYCRDMVQRIEQLVAFGGFSDTKYLERTLAKEFIQLEEWY